MFDGWFVFAGNEIVNNSRFQTYVDNHLPNLRTNHACGSTCGCEHLADFLEEKQYATPMLDEAPWVDMDKPESFEFYGAMSLGTVGLSDDPRTASVVNAMGDGGWVTGRRRGLKEVKFSLLLAAKTEEAMHYGESWLRNALDGECETGCTPTAQLCFLTDCVDPAGFAGVARTVFHNLNEFVLKDGYWSGSTIVLRTADSTATLQLQNTCGNVEWELEISGDSGSSYRVTTDIASDVFRLTGERDTIRATSTDGHITIQPIPVDGLARWQEPNAGTPNVSDTYAQHDTTPPIIDGEPQSEWDQFATLPLSLVVHKAVSQARYTTTDAECAAEYYRFLRRVACVEGPTVRSTRNPRGGGVLRIVDFILNAETPYVFGREMVAATGPSTSLIGGLSPFKVTRLSKNVPECSIVTPKLLRDPQRSVTAPPPQPAQTTDDETYRLTYLKAEERRPNAIIIPADTIPQWANVVPVIRLTSSEDIRFVRVRFMPMPLDSLAPGDLDPCSACGAFEVSYIPRGGTFVIDGADKQAYVLQASKRYEANHLVTDTSGTGVPSWPVLSCGVSYLCVIDTRDQSIANVEIALAVRE